MLIEVLSVPSVVCEIMAGNRVIPLKYPINSPIGIPIAQRSNAWI